MSESDQGLQRFLDEYGEESEFRHDSQSKAELSRLLERLDNRVRNGQGDLDDAGVALFERAWDAEALAYRATGPLEGFDDEVSRGNRAKMASECVTVRIPVNTDIPLIGPKTIEQLKSQGLHTNAEIMNHTAHLAAGIHGVGPQRQYNLTEWAAEVLIPEDKLAVIVFASRKAMIAKRNAKIIAIVVGVAFFFFLLVLAA